jgi:CDP-paratose 2-epimerase
MRPRRGLRGPIHLSVALITGAAGLVGSEAATHFAAEGLDVVGIDNDMRRVFFGAEASTSWNRERLEQRLGTAYRHHDLDIRDREGVARLLKDLGPAVELVIHCAAQPSHDWAAREPFTDFDINAVGTLNVLEAVRGHCPDAAVIFMSTNKVYGDTPNALPLVELDTRWEIEPGHTYEPGIREDMSIDTSLHSLFGASKVAADVLVQEYGRYFGMHTACFRGGTLTGPAHSATELHGFLGYVVRCAMTDTPYTVYGYKGKQVRDAIHSSDLVAAFDAFFREPRSAEVYNIGGGRTSNASVIEAIGIAERLTGRSMTWSYDDTNRVGDHIWWIGDNGRFASHYPSWTMEYDVERIMQEIYDENVTRWTP